MPKHVFKKLHRGLKISVDNNNNNNNNNNDDNDINKINSNNKLYSVVFRINSNLTCLVKNKKKIRNNNFKKLTNLHKFYYRVLKF